MISQFQFFTRDYHFLGCSCPKGCHCSLKPYHCWQNKSQQTILFSPIFLNLPNKKFSSFICVRHLTSSSVWSGFQVHYFWIRSSGLITRNYSGKLMTVLVHKVRSQIKHTLHLHSMYWQPEHTYWLWKFRIRRQIETSELRVRKTSFKKTGGQTQEIFFVAFLLTLFYKKDSLTPHSLLWWIWKSRI